MIGIVDAHHHIWRAGRPALAAGPMVPRIFGPYEPIRRDYPIEEYLADIAGTGVEKSVYVQTNWAKTGAVDEVAWVQSVADEHGWPHAIVGYADLARRRRRRHAEAAGALSAHARHAHAAALARERDVPLRRGARPDERPGASATICAASPTTAGRSTCRSSRARWPTPRGSPPTIPTSPSSCSMPACSEDLSPEGRAAWRDGMKRLADAAEHRLASSPASAPSSTATTPAHIADIVLQTVALFGADRCLFGSNFPIEKLWTELRRPRRRAPRRDRLAARRGPAGDPRRHGDARAIGLLNPWQRFEEIMVGAQCALAPVSAPGNGKRQRIDRRVGQPFQRQAFADRRVVERRRRACRQARCGLPPA